MNLGIVLPGWVCPNCSAFNGCAKTELLQCRCCGENRPRTEERTMLENLTATQKRCTELLEENRYLQRLLEMRKIDWETWPESHPIQDLTAANFSLIAAEHKLPLSEPDRQLVLLALAALSLASPGFDWALNEVARRIDNVEKDRAQMYDQFRACRRKEP